MSRIPSQPIPPLPGWDRPNSVVRPSGRHPTIVPSAAGPLPLPYRPSPPQNFAPSPQSSQGYHSRQPSQAQPAHLDFPHMHQRTHTGAPSLAEVRSRLQPQGQGQPQAQLSVHPSRLQQLSVHPSHQQQVSVHPSRRQQVSVHPSRQQQQQLSAHPQNHPSAHPSRMQQLSVHSSRQPQGFDAVEIAPRASQATRHIQPSGSRHPGERVATDLGQGGYEGEQGRYGGNGGNGGARGGGNGGGKRRLVEVRNKGSGTSRYERR
ncbi:hypothetical protein MMC30_000529 [Trapelia coarctata]|nr:hypothetical protein [Trapelia coarctata]